MHPQESFLFVSRRHYHFDDFVVGANAELYARLQSGNQHGQFTGTWIFAEPGRGKTHLLQAACAHWADRPARSAAYLPLARVSDPEALMGLEDCALVALDDLDRRLGEQDFERALLALYTGLFSTGGHLLIATTHKPAALAAWLPDLASRLRAMASFEVQPLNDHDKALVLRARARLRGLPLADEVLRYWLRRGSRDLQQLLEDLDLLIDYALGEQSGITVPIVKQALRL